MVNEVLDPHKYRCIRCKAPADVIFKGMLPYCFPHEPAESKATRQPKEGEMDESPKVSTTITTDAPVPVTLTPTVPQTVSVGEWTVYAKDGSVLRGEFKAKKDASGWAKIQVEAGSLKAGQYKIAKLS